MLSLILKQTDQTTWWVFSEQFVNASTISYISVNQFSPYKCPGCCWLCVTNITSIYFQYTTLLGPTAPPRGHYLRCICVHCACSSRTSGWSLSIDQREEDGGWCGARSITEKLDWVCFSLLSQTKHIAASWTRLSRGWRSNDEEVIQALVCVKMALVLRARRASSRCKRQGIRTGPSAQRAILSLHYALVKAR